MNAESTSDFVRCLHIAQEVEGLTKQGDYTGVEKLVNRVQDNLAIANGKDPSYVTVLTRCDFEALLQSIEIVSKMASRKPLLNTYRNRFCQFAEYLTEIRVKNAQFKDRTSKYELSCSRTIRES